MAKICGGKRAHRLYYIYICCRVKTWSKNSLFWVKTWSKFSLFFFVFQKSSSFCRENEILKKNEQKKRQKKHNFLSQNLVQFCCATYLDQVLTQPWTKFWLNIFANFGVFVPVWKDAQTNIFRVFSAKNENFKPTPKNLRTLSVNTTALTDFFLSGFSAFLLFGVFVFAVSGFLGGPFLRGMKTTKKRQNSKQNNKNKKGRRTTRCKQEDHLVLSQKKTTQKHNNTNEFFKNGKKQHKTNKQEQNHKT